MGALVPAIAAMAGARAPSSVVEHLTFNQGVPGSIPGGPTKRISSFGRISERSPAFRVSGDVARDWRFGPVVGSDKQDLDRILRFPFAPFCLVAGDNDT